MTALAESQLTVTAGTVVVVVSYFLPKCAYPIKYDNVMMSILHLLTCTCTYMYRYDYDIMTMTMT